MEGATASIDEEIVRLAGMKKPQALFIPTASSDDVDYCAGFKKVYGDKFGCATQSLLLLKNPPSKKEISQIIDDADIIYVGGGNTLMMMRRWRFLGVDTMLIKACRKGTVMAGTSAGAICWFRFGHSDSMAYYHPENWKWIRVKCLGILPLTACPHYLKENRDKHFQDMIMKKGGMGIALDDCTAFEVVGNQFRILQSKQSAKAFRVYKEKGRIHNESFPPDHKFKPLKSPFEK